MFKKRDRLIFDMKIKNPGKEGLYIAARPQSHISKLGCTLYILFRLHYFNRYREMENHFPLGKLNHCFMGHVREKESY